MHAARAGLIALALLTACSARGKAPAAAMWRDQWVFIGDDGTVLPLALVRRANGEAEAKGWLGQDGKWRTNFYEAYTLGGAAPSDAAAALDAWSRGGGRAGRASLHRTATGLSIQLRTPTTAWRIDAATLELLGEATDPEGPSRYRAGRAALHAEGGLTDGWLLVEETPADRPRKPLVDYGGDYLLVFAASPTGDAVVMRRSLGAPAYDHAVVRRAGAVRAAAGVRAERAGGTLSLAVPEAGLEARLTVEDVSPSRGVAPDGSPVAYEVLLLGGELRGVAFAIRRVR